MIYLFGFILVFLEKIVISIANIFDSELSRKTFKSVYSIVILNGLLIIPVLPILYFLLQPQLLDTPQLLLIIIVSFIEVLYQIPYYMALRYSETSLVVSMFGFGRILTPIFAYFIIHETLTLSQYIGFGIIVLASIIGSINKQTFKVSKALYYMIPVAILLAFQDVIEKAGLNLVDWKTFYFWFLTLSVPFYLILFLLISKSREEVFIFFRKPFQKKYIPIYAQNLSLWVSGGLGTLALSLLPVTIIKTFGSFHSLIVHLVSSKGAKQLNINGERFSWKKIGLFLLIGIGIILTLNI